MKCPLCGLKFRKKDAGTACGGCVFIRGCKLVKCPNCGYEMAEEIEGDKDGADR